jgi:hypothetical protein
MNLAEHFFQDDHAFVTFKELGNWCQKNGFFDPTAKRGLLECLLGSGGKQGIIQWQGGEKQKAVLGFGLLDFSLAEDKMYFGKGVTITKG